MDICLIKYLAETMPQLFESSKSTNTLLFTSMIFVIGITLFLVLMPSYLNNWVNRLFKKGKTADKEDIVRSSKQELAQAGFLSSEIEMLTAQPILKDIFSKLRGTRKAWLEHLLAEGVPLDKYVEEVKAINKEIKENKE
jgi:hypothetical protein